MTLAVKLALITMMACGVACGSNHKGHGKDNASGKEGNGEDGAKGGAGDKNGGKQAGHFVQTSKVNGVISESFAIFVVKGVGDADVMGATLNGKKLDSAMEGFEHARIETGHLSKEALDGMFNGTEVGLTAEEKAETLKVYDGALYFYIEDFSFDFQKEGMTNAIVVSYGKNAVVSGSETFNLDGGEG